MCRWFISVGILMLCFVPVQTVLAEDFYLGIEPPAEGWVVGPGIIPSFSNSRGVTEGSYSLRMQGPGSTWWSEDVYVDLGALEGGIDAFYAHDTFTIDVSVYKDEWSMDTAIGWVSAPVVSLLLNPGSGQWWNLGAKSIGDPLTGDHMITAFWNYAALRDQVTDPQGVMKMILAFNNYGYAGSSSFYIDNSWLQGVPEPATLALLGFGALTLLRKKK